MVYIAVFAVLIAICSWISIPTTVPFTLQTFAVFLAVGVLGGKRGSLSVLIYILHGSWSDCMLCDRNRMVYGGLCQKFRSSRACNSTWLVCHSFYYS